MIGIGLSLTTIASMQGGGGAPPAAVNLTSKSGTDLTDKSGSNVLTSKAA
jgi:hypothetical protein